MIDIGLVGTEMLYFAVGNLDLDGGIQVMASHKPECYGRRPESPAAFVR